MKHADCEDKTMAVEEEREPGNLNYNSSDHEDHLLITSDSSHEDLSLLCS